jgi:hypothetical protein
MKKINVMAFYFKLLGSMKIHPMFHSSLLEPYHIASTIQEKILERFPHLIEINGEQEFKIKYLFY